MKTCRPFVPVFVLLAISLLDLRGEVIQTVPGPISANGGGEGVEFINIDNDADDWLTKVSAGGTIYIGFDWTVDNNVGETGTGGYFGGLGLYDGTTEKALVGNSWTSLNFGLAGQGTDSSSTIPYVIGTSARLIAKLTVVDGGDPDTLELFVNQITEGVADATNVLAIDDISRVLSRAGNGSGAGTIANVIISDDYESAAAPLQDSDADGLPDGSFEQQIIDAAAAEDPPRTLTLADVKGPRDAPETSDYDMDELSDADEFAEGTDPTNPDSDGDGLSDGKEINLHETSPFDPDTDDDGLSDGEEINQYSTDPTLSDSDSDDFSDLIEVSSGSSPNDGGSVPTVLTPFDQPGVTGGGAGITVIGPGDIEALLGQPADDAFAGTISYSGTIEFTQLANGTGEFGFAGIQLYDGDTEQIGVGDQWVQSNWSGYRAPDGSIFALLDDGNPVPLATGAPETITVVVEMVAGGDDTVTVIFRGAEQSFTGPLRFDQLRVRCGNDDQAANFTKLSLRVGIASDFDTQVTTITHDEASGKSKITWRSEPDAKYRIDYSPDLGNWDGEVIDEVLSQGDATSLEFTLESLALPADTARVYYRVVPLE